MIEVAGRYKQHRPACHCLGGSVLLGSHGASEENKNTSLCLFTGNPRHRMGLTIYQGKCVVQDQILINQIGYYYRIIRVVLRKHYLYYCLDKEYIRQIHRKRLWNFTNATEPSIG
ncbi:MAG: hypothetical protein B6D74_00005, partial [gamma proteobacterium symbiont of Ctena orbiculata]